MCPLRDLCAELSGSRKGSRFQEGKRQTTGVRLQKVYPLFLLPGDVPEEGNQSEVDEKQIIKSATVYRIAMVFSQDQDRGKPDNYQKAHNRG